MEKSAMTLPPDSRFPYDPADAEADGIELVGYHNLEGKEAFKLGLHVVNDRWYLYGGSLWHPGVSVLDVTDPSNPTLVKWLRGPENTFTFQVQVAGGKLINGLERPFSGYGRDTSQAGEGFDIYDLSNPIEPALLGSWSTGSEPYNGPDNPPRSASYGTHRNFYDGGRYVHASATAAGYQGHIYRIIDIDDPARPVEVGRWWLPEQWNGMGRFHNDPFSWTFLHGPAWVEGERAFCSYGAGGMVILDISDFETPRLVSQLNPGPAFGSPLGVHSAVPIPDRGLVVMNTEAIAEGGSKHEPLNYAVVVDVADETEPRIISWLPVPEPGPGSPFKSFHDKPGRFGPHNQHHWQHHPHLKRDDSKVYLTYFNAGLRIFDISDAYRPREIAYYIAPNPTERLGPQPEGGLVTQCEDVLVDSRGFIYTCDKNWGIHILRQTGG
jgi:hypothetical protein